MEYEKNLKKHSINQTYLDTRKNNSKILREYPSSLQQDNNHPENKLLRTRESENNHYIRVIKIKISYVFQKFN
jgi:hypothetical protein